MHNLKQAEIAMQNEFREMRSKAEDPFTRRKSRPTLVTKVLSNFKAVVNHGMQIVCYVINLAERSDFFLAAW